MTRWTHQQLVWGLFLAFGGSALLILLSDPAFAQATPASSSFSCSGTHASGDLIAKSSACPTELKWDNIFSFLVCHVESMTSQIFGNLYCGVIQELIPAVKAALTLSVVTFGVGFTIGVIPATAREFLSFLLKVTFIWVFATQADYMIGYGYNFFVAGLREGTAIAISGVIPTPPGGTPISSAADVYGFLDEALHNIIGFASATAGADWGAGGNPCQNAIFAAIAVMALAFPPLFLLSALLLCKIIMVFLRAVFGYMFSIVGIAFLMTLAPIFLSMALFKQTRKWFDKYLAYLASFTLQMVIVFTFIAMIITMNPSKLMGSISQLVVRTDETIQTSSFRWPWQYCTLCKFEVVEDNGTFPVTVNADGTTTTDHSTGGRVRDMDSEQIHPGSDIIRCKTPMEKFPILQAAMPDETSDDVNVLMKFAGTAILSLIILAYIVDQLLFYVPSLAWRLASSMSSGVYAPQIGGGQGQSISVTAGPLELMDTAGEGFYRGYTRSLRDGETPIPGISGAEAARQGIAEAGRSFMFGVQDTRGAQHHGVIDGFMRFIVNPNAGTSEEI